MKTPSLRLNPNEEILYTMRTHPKVLFVKILAGLSCLVLSILTLIYMPVDKFPLWLTNTIQISLLCLGLWYCVFPIIQWMHSMYVITTKQIVILEGVFVKKTHSSQLSRVSDLNVERGILDRIYKCGTLVVFNASGGMGDVNEGSTRVTLKDIPDVLGVEEKIKQLVFNRNNTEQ